VLTAVGLLCLATSLYFLALSHEVAKYPRRTGTARPGTRHEPVSSPDPHPPVLHVTSIVQHGRIIEIKGTAEPGAVVMINGQAAATMFEENGFHHFLGPLSVGLTIVSITCQDEQGGVNTQQLAVTLE
jgi:hypothetical protein